MYFNKSLRLALWQIVGICHPHKLPTHILPVNPTASVVSLQEALSGGGGMD